MFSHATIGANDYAVAKAFYDATLAPLGIRCFQEWPHAGWAGFKAKGDMQTFWLCRPQNGEAAAPGNGTMTAFLAADTDAVHAAHAAALAHGGSCEGPPGPRPQYGDFYAAYVRDPEGNKLCFVHRVPSKDGAPA